MAKNQTGSASKSGGSDRPSNISPGGHIYDRTTGEWVGEGSRELASLSSSGVGTKVLHDANGVVGVQFTSSVGNASAQGAPANAAPQASATVAQSAKPGVTAVPAPAPKASGGGFVATAANRGAFRPDWNRGDAWSGKDDPVQDMVFGGYHWQASPKWTNGDMIEVRFGDTEIVQEIVGLAIVGADIGHNAARHVFGPNVNNMGPQARMTALQGMAAEGAKRGIQGSIDGMFNMGAAIQQAAAENKAYEVATQAAKDAFNDVLDYKMLLQQQETNAMKDRQVDEKWRLEEVRRAAIAAGPAPLP